MVIVDIVFLLCIMCIKEKKKKGMMILMRN